MRQRRVAVCGAPAVGKSSLLAALAHEMGHERPVLYGQQHANLVWLDIAHSMVRTSFLTIMGSFNHAQSSVLPWLLRSTHAIVYVVAAVPP